MSEQGDKIAEELAEYFKQFEHKAMIGFRDFAWGVYQICLMRGQSHKEAYTEMVRMADAIMREGLEVMDEKIEKIIKD